MKYLFAASMAVTTAFSLVTAGPVLAQTDEDDSAVADAAIEEILVTGSRIARDSFNVSTPLNVMDTEAIQDQGLGSLAEMLVDGMPAVFEATGNTNSQSYVNATGLTTMSLRNQGTVRTLVLIDGRRTVPSQFSSTAVSLNTIPTPLVQRVEIITGGSSAAYGSDAIAGVVNIITQQDKVGLAIESRYGATTNGGGEEVSVDVQYGTNYADGRGYLFLAGTFDDQQGIGPFDRDRARIEADFDYDPEALCNAMQTAEYNPQPAFSNNPYDHCLRDIAGGPEVWRNRSDGTPGGVFEEGRGNGGYWYDENNVLRDDWVEERDGIFSAQFVQLKVPEDRYNLALKNTYDFDNNISATFQVMYAENNSFNIKSPEDEYDGGQVLVIDRITGAADTITPGKISPDNPFVPPEVFADNNGSIDWERRMFEVGNIMTDNNRTTIRSWAGLQGEFANEWQWDVSVGYGKSTQSQIRFNEINVVRERQALDAEYAADGVTIQCADPAARAAGCVPLNVFGVGSITPEMADWLRVTPTIDSDVTQHNVLAFVSGDLFEMPNGTVPVVFGVEYRKDEINLRTDEGSQYGGITFNIIPSFSGKIDVSEVFGETLLPLTDNLSAELSVRIADYSPPGISTVYSYTTGVIWEPAEGYRLRANFARAQRAPNVPELFSPPRGDYDSISDICDGTTATSDDPGHDNCRLEPGIAATIAQDGFFEDDNNGYGPSAGNPNLFEETGETYTLGFSIAPGWAEGLRLAVDYWEISIDDKIDEISNSEILKQCYNSSQPWGDSNPFCNEISRHDADGQIYQIMNRDYNLDSGKTRGMDVAMDYTFEFDTMGDLVFALDYTHMFEDSDVYEGLDGLETTDYTNQLDYGNFDDRAVASLTWRRNDWRVRWTTRYLSSVADDNERLEDWDFYRTRNDDRCAAGELSCVANPEVPMYLYYPSYTRHDIAVNYLMQTESFGTLRLFGGIRNVFDDMGPFMPTGGDTSESGPGNSDNKYGGLVGQFAYLGFEIQFE